MVSSRRKRGAALVLVLVVLAATSLTMATLAERSGRMKLARDSRDHASSLERLLDEAERVVAAWLERASPQVVLGAEVAIPSLELLDWAANGLGMRITAFDQFGMCPLEQVVAGSSLRMALPNEVVDAVDRVGYSQALLLQPGLDDFAPSMVTAFPTSDGHLSVGAHVATHSSTPTTINVATAPAELLRIAYRLAGLASPSPVLQARAEGEAPPSPGQVSSPGGDPWVFTAKSESWAFRIDLASGPIHRSWWVVFQGSGDAWTPSQRLLIDA